MLKYLCDMFGKENINKQSFNISGLPIYMNSYEYELFTMFNKTFIFIKNKNEFNINSYLKHRKLIEEKYNCDTVLVLNNSKEVQRQNLINNRIMFVEKNKYIFMPAIGLVFSKPKFEIYNIKLTSQENIVAMSFLYIGDDITVKDIIAVSNINKMTISRALSKLDSANLVKHEIKSNVYHYSLCVDKKTYINKLLLIMKNPIKQKVIVNEKSIEGLALYAGITAISNNSMLANDQINTYALYETDFDKVSFYKPYMDGLIINSNEAILEIWDYDPSIYSQNDNAELISVIKTINIDDERVNNEIEVIKDRY